MQMLSIKDDTTCDKQRYNNFSIDNTLGQTSRAIASLRHTPKTLIANTHLHTRLSSSMLPGKNVHSLSVSYIWIR